MACVALASAAHAVTFLSQDFTTATGTTPPTGWTVSTPGNPAVFWRFDNPGSRLGVAPIAGNFAVADSDWFGTSTINEDTILTSPPFSTVGAANVFLQFDCIYRNIGTGSAASTITVEAFNGTSWIVVFSQQSPDIGAYATGTSAPIALAISTITGNLPNAQIRFRWTGTFDWWWIIDNILVSDVPPASAPAAPVLTVMRNFSTTPIVIANASTVSIPHNSTVASAGLVFALQDQNFTDTLSIVTVVNPSANIAGFVQSQWNAGPSTLQPMFAAPSSGTFSTIGNITVSITATDGVSAPILFSFTLSVEPPNITLGVQGTGNAFPFNYSTASGRFQTAYAAADLTIGANQAITELHVFGSTLTAPTYGALRIRMGYTTMAVNAMSATFDLNAPSLTTVLGPVDIQPASIAGTGGNWYVFPLAVPFIYNGTDTLVVDWSYESRSGTGFTISTSTPPAPEQTRSRVYMNGGNAYTVSGTAAVSGGNYGIKFFYTPAGPLGNMNFISNNTLANPYMVATAVDRVHLDLSVNATPAAQNLNGLAITKTGTVPDGAITSVKLVRDNNNDGVVNTGDTTLGSTTFSGGTALFVGAPLQAVTGGGSARLLVALTYSSLTVGNDIRLSVVNGASAVWSGGTSYSVFPIESPLYVVEPPQYTLGSPTGGGNSIPFNGSYYGYMTCYSGAEMTGLIPGSQITGLRIHAPSAIAPLGSWASMVIRIGPSTTDPNVMSSTWDANFSAAPTTVLNEVNYTPVLLPGTQNVARVYFQLTTPYVYMGGGLCIHYIMGIRTGNGFTVTSVAGRQRVYTSTNPPAVTGTLTTSGNYGLDLDYQLPASGVAMLNTLGGPPIMATPQVDTIGLQLSVNAFGTASTLTSLAVTRVGTVTDGQISNMKLVRDVNLDGQVDGGDVVLGSGTLTAGKITFTGTPLTTIPTGPPTQLLVAFTIPTAVSIGSTLGFEIAAAADAVFSTGPDLSGYPIASGLAAQAMGGTYTIAQSGPADFNDIGAAFNALETNGVSAPVTLLVTDSATYQSTDAYTLGYDNAAIPNRIIITGVSATNRITLMAGPGAKPKIQGNATGAVMAPQSTTVAHTGRGGLCINHSYVTVEGLEVYDGPNFGILTQGNNSLHSLNLTDITIRRCIVHDIPNGPGIAHVGYNSGWANNYIVEHNFVYNTNTVALTATPVMQSLANGAITIRNTPSLNGAIVRHNTVLHTSTLVDTGGIFVYNTSGAFPLQEMTNNIVICTNPGVPAVRLGGSGAGSITYAPIVSDYNFLFTSTTCNVAAIGTFALWQASARDANGSDADPLLVSTSGTIDLHLQAGSPCRNPAAQNSTATIDIDGDTRPAGATVDIGADEFVIPPEVDVQINAASIASGGSFNAGVFNVAGQPFTFTILNTGAGDLLLTGNPAVQISLGANLDVTTVVQTQPALTTLPPTSGSTTFTVFVDPTNPGAWDLTVSFTNSDTDENPYTFTIQGNAVPVNVPAEAAIAAGSSFAGAVNGPFTQAVNPGAALATADIELTDADTDNITITSIVPPATALAGVTAPTAGAPGHPVLLSWTGTVADSNAPGAYTWTITFEDAVNGTPVVIDVTITVNDLAPTHSAVTGISGNGSAATPYLTTYTVGLTGAVSVDLADVTDPNTSQVLSISNVSDVSNLGGTGFQFVLASGVLNVAPLGALSALDAGGQLWEVTISDGTNAVVVSVSITVNDAITFTSPTTLTAAHFNGTYPGTTITHTGGTGAVTLAITGGALPANLSMSTAGVVTGTTTDAVATYNFTVTATDSLGASTSLGFSIDVIDPPAGLPTITNGSALPTGTLNVPYSVALTVTGGTAPYAFSLDSGTLPSGLTLSAGGVISGTPGAVGPSTFTVRVVDSSSRGVFNNSSFTLAIVAPKKEEDSSCAAGLGAGLPALLGIFGLAGMIRRRRK